MHSIAATICICAFYYEKQIHIFIFLYRFVLFNMFASQFFQFYRSSVFFSFQFFCFVIFYTMIGILPVYIRFLCLLFTMYTKYIEAIYIYKCITYFKNWIHIISRQTSLQYCHSYYTLYYMKKLWIYIPMCVEALQKQFSLNTFYQKIYVWKCRIGFSFWTTMSIKLEMKIYLLFISRKKRHCLFSKLSVCKSRKKLLFSISHCCMVPKQLFGSNFG